MAKSEPKADPPQKVRFVAKITLRNGRVIYARDYGHKAFPIRSGSMRRSMKRGR